MNANLEQDMDVHKPLWKRVARSIEESIRRRDYVPGDKLPTEAEFSRAFMVNRHTLRRALAHLQEKGLVESTQGRGTYVRRPSLRYTLGKRTRFTEILSSQALNAQTRTRRIDIRPAPQRVADGLGLAPGAPVVRLDRIGFAGDEPISLSTHYFSQRRFPSFMEFYRRHKSVTQTLLHSGVPDYTRLKTVVQARMPMPDEVEILHIPRHVPLIVTHAWNVDGLGQPLEYGESCFASDRLELEIESGPPPGLTD